MIDTLSMDFGHGYTGYVKGTPSDAWGYVATIEVKSDTSVDPVRLWWCQGYPTKEAALIALIKRAKQTRSSLHGHRPLI
jgi:hypothetical protein